MFARETFEQVAEAYIRGLEQRARKGRGVRQTASVASLFVSRVDTSVDKILQQAGAPEELRGKAAIANSRLLYQSYKEIFHGPRFAALRTSGARPQRLLWGSTSTKNPKYSDVMYAEALIGPETVDTMPDVTITAFRDHGKARASLEEGVDEARRTFERVAQAGVDVPRSHAAASGRRRKTVCRLLRQVDAVAGLKARGPPGRRVQRELWALAGRSVQPPRRQQAVTGQPRGKTRNGTGNGRTGL